MSEAQNADSAGAPGEATGETPTPVAVSDSTPDLSANGQEQGEQSESKRVNGLMSLANQRLTQRDEALAEIEALKAQLAEHEAEGREEAATPSQAELMHPEPVEFDGDAMDPMEPPEPPTIRVGANGAFRPGYGPQPTQSQALSPSAQYLRDQSDIAAMKQQLNTAGQNWARERGLTD